MQLSSVTIHEPCMQTKKAKCKTKCANQEYVQNICANQIYVQTNKVRCKTFHPMHSVPEVNQLKHIVSVCIID